MKYKITAIIISSMFFCSSILSMAQGYTDVSSGHWGYEAINEFSSSGYISGYDDNTFRPSSPMTRAETAAILNKINGYTQTAEISFSDVASSAWYYPEVQKAAFAGYTAGYSDNTFRPGANITREEMSVIINNIYKLEQGTVADFKDSAEISSWSRDSVNALVSAGIMNGYPDMTFRPKQPVTRAEVIAILNGLIDKNTVTAEQPGGVVPAADIPAAVTQPPKSLPSGGGGSSSPGTNQPPLTEQETKEKLQDVVEDLNSLVIPELSTAAQAEAAGIISSSINKFLSDDDYDISSDVDEVRDIVETMSELEKNEFKNTITSNIPISALKELNKKFNLISY